MMRVTLRAMHPLLPLYIFTAALTVLSAPWAFDWPMLPWVTKPLTTVLVIVYAWRRAREGDPQRWPIIAGLVCSLGGDVALLFPQGFVAGLVCFLLAHLAYLVAFTRQVRLATQPLAWAAWALAAGAVLMVLWPGVPQGLQLPVVAYVTCLAAMAAQAMTVWAAQPEPPARADSRDDAHDDSRDPVRRRRRLAGWAALGGGLFVFSDAMLATNKFMAPLPAATLWVLPAYWAAQWLIASSLNPRR